MGDCSRTWRAAGGPRRGGRGFRRSAGNPADRQGTKKAGRGPRRPQETGSRPRRPAVSPGGRQ